MLTNQIISIVVIVILVIVVLAIIMFLLRRRSIKPVQESRDESDSRISVGAPKGESRYRVTKGKLLEDESQAKAEQPKVEVQATNENEFPRNLAMAGNKMNDYLPKNSVEASPRFQVEAGNNNNQDDESEEEPVVQSQHQAQNSLQRRQVESHHKDDSERRTVTVARLADLFSPKENLEEEFGVDEAELKKLVAAHKKKTEYKERRLPVNAHFNIQDYKDSKNVMRESAINVNSTRGSKRGQITAQIYKKHGKNFTVQKHDVTGGNMSIETEDEHKPVVRQPRNQGKLVVKS